MTKKEKTLTISGLLKNNYNVANVSVLKDLVWLKISKKIDKRSNSK